MEFNFFTIRTWPFDIKSYTNPVLCTTRIKLGRNLKLSTTGFPTKSPLLQIISIYHTSQQGWGFIFLGERKLLLVRT
ncbi:hypothetical protein CJT59_09400 [Pseudomonas aeruginosa]|nr:hypothetical protein APA96_03490 [Pseudomonas aeruginosa]PBY35078.1 hypothetical protein CJT59_09400 [Pseudomonas aeruginosa]